MRRKKLRYPYDREADVMSLYFDRPRRAKTVELADDFVLRLDPATERGGGEDGHEFLQALPFPARPSTG